MGEVAGVQHEGRWLGCGLDLRDRGAQRRGDIGVRGLVEADVAVADLREPKAAAAGMRRPRAPGLPGANMVIRADGETIGLKGRDEIAVAPGDQILIATPGGGGTAVSESVGAVKYAVGPAGKLPSCCLKVELL